MSQTRLTEAQAHLKRQQDRAKAGIGTTQIEQTKLITFLLERVAQLENTVSVQALAQQNGETE